MSIDEQTILDLMACIDQQSKDISSLIEEIQAQTQAVAELSSACLALAESVTQMIEEEAEEASEEDFPRPLSRKQ